MRRVHCLEFNLTDCINKFILKTNLSFLYQELFNFFATAFKKLFVGCLIFFGNTSSEFCNSVLVIIFIFKNKRYDPIMAIGIPIK